MSDKKLDILIKVGVGLIFLSVFIFATSTWNVMSSLVKVIILFIGTLFFYGLSYFTGNNLKLEKSSFMYYVISLIMMVCTLLAVGFFETFGTWYSFNGDGVLFFFSNLFLLGSFAFFRLFKKKNSKVFAVFSYYTLVISTFIFGLFIELDVCLITLLLAAFINAALYLFKDKINFLKVHVYIISLLLFVINFFCVSDSSFLAPLTNLLMVGVFVGNAFLNAPKNGFEKAVVPILILFNVIDWLRNFNADFYTSELVLAYCSLLFLVFNLVYNYKNKPTLITSFVIYAIFIAFSSLVFLIDKTSPVLYFAFMAIGLLLSLYFRDKFKPLYFSFTALLVLTIFNGCIYFNIEDFILISFMAAFALMAFFNRKDNIAYYIVYNAIMIFTVTVFDFFVYNPTIGDHTHLIFGSLPLFIVINNYLKEKYYKKFDMFVYISTMIAVFKLCMFDHELLDVLMINDTLYAGSIIFAILVLILYCYSKRNLFYKIFSSVALFIPYIVISLYYVDLDQLRYIVSAYFLINAIYYFNKTKVFNKILFFLVLLLFLGFSGEVNTSVVVGWFIDVAYILFGFNNNKSKFLGITGLVFLLLSLVSNLFQFWTSIPVYVYLFILGVIVIGFVTIKEKKKNKDNNELSQKSDDNNLEKEVKNQEIPHNKDKKIEKDDRNIIGEVETSKDSNEDKSTDSHNNRI